MRSILVALAPFTNWDGERYQKRADELSWDALSDFLATNLSQ